MKILFILLFLVACNEQGKKVLMSQDPECKIEPKVELISTVLGCKVYSVREAWRQEDVSCETSQHNTNAGGGRRFLLSKCETPSSVQYDCGKNCQETNSTN